MDLFPQNSHQLTREGSPSRSLSFKTARDFHEYPYDVVYTKNPSIGFLLNMGEVHSEFLKAGLTIENVIEKAESPFC